MDSYAVPASGTARRNRIRSPTTRDISSHCSSATSRGLAICEAFCSTCRALPDRDFRILLEKVLYDGTHTGDWISSKIAEKLLKEVDAVLHSSDILADSEKEFFNNMKLLRGQRRNWKPGHVLNIRTCRSGIPVS